MLPDASRARSVIVYRPGAWRNRFGLIQLRVYAPHGRGAARVEKRRFAERTRRFVSVTRIPRFRAWSSQIRTRA